MLSFSERLFSTHGAPQRTIVLLRLSVVLTVVGIIWIPGTPGTAQPLEPDSSAVLSLSVTEALEHARTTNFSARTADAKRRAATARKRQSMGVFLPRITASEQGMSTTDPVHAFGFTLKQERFTQQDFAIGALNSPDRVDHFSTQVEVEQPILNLDGIFQRRAAGNAARAAAKTVERTDAVVAFRVKKSYYSLLLAERRVGVIDSALAVARSNRDQAQALYEEGLVDESDRLAAEVRVSELENRRTEAQAQHRNAADRLRVLLGIGERVQIEPTDSLERERTNVGSVPIGQVNRQRSDMQALRARADAAREKTRSRWLAFVPTINARGTAGWYDDSPFGTAGHSWTAGASLTWNLFEGYQQVGAAQEAEAELRRAEIALEQRSLENQVEIASARRNLQSARDRIEQTRTAIDQAEESLRIRSARYDQGLTQTTALLQAETTVAERRLAYLRALYQHNVTLYRLELLTEQVLTK